MFKNHIIVDANENTLRSFQCPACYDDFTEKIYICQRAHNVCKKCAKLVTVCPLCKYAITKTRNYTLEAAVGKIKEERDHSKHAHHHHSCFMCASSSTKHSANLQQFLKNFKNAYISCTKGFVYQHDFQNTDMQDLSYDFVVVEFNKEFLRLCVKMDNKNKIFCFAVQKYDYQKCDSKRTFELGQLFRDKKPFGVIKIVKITERVEHAFSADFAKIEQNQFPQRSTNSVAVKVYCRFTPKSRLPFKEQ